jgi:hypothetical protein
MMKEAFRQLGSERYHQTEVLNSGTKQSIFTFLAGNYPGLKEIVFSITVL